MRVDDLRPHDQLDAAPGETVDPRLPGSHLHLKNDRGSEGRTTASEGHSCEQCGAVLKGRRQRFCSDRCRMRDRRREQQARLNELLAAIEQSVTALRQELWGRNDSQR